MTDPSAMKERNKIFKIPSDTLFLEMFVLECQVRTKLSFIAEGHALKWRALQT
jgi:hypothetical protein